jgi:signal recognition particle GTPase
MLTITWQEEIASLKQDLSKEINKISVNSDINIPNHICINNLKSKLERLDEIEKILNIEKYKIAFIGTIGQGKTTAICHLFNLISDFHVSKTIANRSRNIIETKELLSTGAGRTTISVI